MPARLEQIAVPTAPIILTCTACARTHIAHAQMHGRTHQEREWTHTHTHTHTCYRTSLRFCYRTLRRFRRACEDSTLGPFRPVGKSKVVRAERSRATSPRHQSLPASSAGPSRTQRRPQPAVGLPPAVPCLVVGVAPNRMRALQLVARPAVADKEVDHDVLRERACAIHFTRRRVHVTCHIVRCMPPHTLCVGRNVRCV